MPEPITILIALFFCAYILPSIILDLLQSQHIKAQLQKPAILLENDDYVQAGQYALSSLHLSIIGKCIESILFILWVSVGLKLLAQSLDSIQNHFIQGVALVLGFVIISSLIDLPLSIYKTLKLDKQFGFSKQTPMLFMMDTFKSLALTIAIGGLIIFILIAVIEYFTLWWLVGFATLFCVLILTNLIYPTLIAPLFNKFTPLNDELLKSRIESLLDSVGFKSNGVFVIDASKRDGRLNAYFGGIGKSKRVVLFDTLLDKISTDGLIAILGHELGHFKHKDIFKNIALMGCILFILFFIVGHLPTSLFTSLGLESNGAGVLLVMLLITPMVSFLFMPIIGYFSRKAEYAADEFGASLSSKHCLANALVRLVNENKSFPSSHPAYIFFYYTHPPLLQRLKALEYEL